MNDIELIIVQAPANIPAGNVKEIILDQERQGWTLVKSYNSIQKNIDGTDDERRINFIFKKKK